MQESGFHALFCCFMLNANNYIFRKNKNVASKWHYCGLKIKPIRSKIINEEMKGERYMKVISMINQKGGVGKTTSTYNIAVLLARKYRVLMIDSDSQASLTLMTANNPLALDYSLADVYSGNKNIEDCIYQLPIDNLSLISSNLSLAKLETTLMAVPFGRETKLEKALKRIEEQFDYVIVDCPPSLGILTINSLVASDYVIAPCETSPLSVYALDDLTDTINAVKEINGRLTLLGVIATKYNKIAKSDRASLDSLEEEYKILGIIKNSVSAKKGIEDGIPCVISDSGSDVAKSYNEITNRILEEVENG